MSKQPIIMKKGKPQSLLVQFINREQQPECRLFQDLKQFLISNSIPIKSDPPKPQYTEIGQGVIKIYHFSKSEAEASLVQKYTSECLLPPIRTIYYLTDLEHQSEFDLAISHNAINTENCQVIAIRQGLEGQYLSIEAQVQNTLSRQESLRFLESLCVFIIDCEYQKQIGFYDNNVPGIKVDNLANQSFQRRKVLLKAMIEQIPGFSSEKASVVVQAYSTLQKLYEAIQKKEVQTLKVKRGASTANLGPALAARLQTVFCQDDPKVTII